MNTPKHLDKERSFSVELNSKQTLKTITLGNSPAENVLIEGTIGKLEKASFVSEDILEVVGSMGVIRVNVAETEIMEAKQQ